MMKRGEAPWSMTANSWQYTTIYDVHGIPMCRLDLENWGVTEDNQDTLETEQAQIARLIAAAPLLLDACIQAEACMSIVAPRSDTAEYMRILDVVRSALAAATQADAGEGR